jgi:hypothetical protein
MVVTSFFILRSRPLHSRQGVEGQCSAVGHLIVKAADIEFGSQFFPRALAEFTELKLAQLVAERLRGPRDVTVRLGLNGRLVVFRMKATT